MLPHLEVVHGAVGGLEPAESNMRAIRIVRPGGGDLTVTATAVQVEQASHLREISAMVVMGPEPRLIWIRQAGADVPVPSAEERDAHTLRKWSELLRRLAQ
ncbi:hypothetical protein D7Y27_25645 [Corallococcus sp. AB004]|uniref:hypothetical protein n=1 Tax=Corallococcus TaxID=83461 RepID=UPI000EA1D1B8|nr:MULTISPECIES: hypothetical protein [Corallococcus]RKI37431.1 hypothetical protein D7Y27_25645 [Corallococcus sp. AB004]NPC73410.1 hypothetical protein [Corallococcus exiguus]NPD29321.1 hypothetical protein [Corallococcus exiguus]NRD48844.1 hypothetical protein [Corallococcus exiguus]RKH97598.1 hypothetical protein D7Y04_26230 [Corallococcus sp. AB038B]